MNELTVTVAGNLVSDVELRQTSRGEAMARFRLASSVRRWDRAAGRWVEGDTSYWRVTAWRRAAENAAVSLAKGHPVIVHGRLRQRVADRPVPGAPGTTMTVTYTDIEALAFGLDVTRCRSTFVRAPIGPQTSDAASADGAGGGGQPGGAGQGAADQGAGDQGAGDRSGGAGRSGDGPDPDGEQAA